MPVYCMAYYGEEQETSGFTVFCFIIALLYFILTVVALFKIIAIAKDVKQINNRIEDYENPYYYYLMGNKEKAKEILSKQMVRDMELKWSGIETFDIGYWERCFERIECEMPDVLKDIRCIDDYRNLYDKRKRKEQEQ